LAIIFFLCFFFFLLPFLPRSSSCSAIIGCCVWFRYLRASPSEHCHFSRLLVLIMYTFFCPQYTPFWREGLELGALGVRDALVRLGRRDSALGALARALPMVDDALALRLGEGSFEAACNGMLAASPLTRPLPIEEVTPQALARAVRHLVPCPLPDSLPLHISDFDWASLVLPTPRIFEDLTEEAVFASSGRAAAGNDVTAGVDDSGAAANSAATASGSGSGVGLGGSGSAGGDPLAALSASLTTAIAPDQPITFLDALGEPAFETGCVDPGVIPILVEVNPAVAISVIKKVLRMNNRVVAGINNA
jgi:hypothetical protein